MKKIKKYLKDNHVDLFEYQADNGIRYIITPKFIVFKEDNVYKLSFHVGETGADIISIFVNIQGQFINQFEFEIVEDCFVQVDNGVPIEFSMGDMAYSEFCQYIYENFKYESEISPDTVFH